MTKQEVIDLQTMLEAAGFDPGQLDGIYGPRTKAAHESYKSTIPAPAESAVISSSLNHWPNQGNVPIFFGRHEIGRDGMPTERWKNRCLTQIRLPFPMRLAWDTETTVQRITCHRMIAKDLGEVLADILRHYGSAEAVSAARMDLFGGCYNYRPMRTSANLSMHSWGIAIDLDPERNGLGKKWKPNSGMMPEEVIAIFERHGWTWGGRWRTPDSMHFQAATI